MDFTLSKRALFGLATKVGYWTFKTSSAKEPLERVLFSNQQRETMSSNISFSSARNDQSGRETDEVPILSASPKECSVESVWLTTISVTTA